MYRGTKSKRVIIAGTLISAMLIMVALFGCLRGQGNVSDRCGGLGTGSAETSQAE